MRKIYQEVLNWAYDICNDSEIRTQNSDKYIDLTNQLKHLKNSIKQETDKDRMDDIFDQIDELYMDIYNYQLINCIKRLILAFCWKCKNIFKDN